MWIQLSHLEKMKVMSIVGSWEREQITQEVLRSIQKDIGIPARYVEIMFWHYDILSLFAETDWLIFKGGTCVQSFIRPGYQRASMDLDFNSSIGNPNAIKCEISILNKMMDKKGAHVTVQGIDFGKIEFIEDDVHSGTLNFIRRMPTRFGDMEKVGDDRIQAKSIRIQINYKNAWLPALSPIDKVPEFFILDYQKPKKLINMTHSSKEDLIADKVLATCNVGGFGRERFKDIYDIGMLLKDGYDKETISKKLGLVGKKAKIEPTSLIKGAVETISDFAIRGVEARGFASMVANAGQDHVKDWESFCFRIADELKGLRGYV